MPETTKTTALLPCPFCGSKPLEQDGFLPVEEVMLVFCSDIECSLHSVEIGFTRKTWNERATMPGWKLVPIDPTNDMKLAGGMIPDAFRGTLAARGNADRVYKAMIAAAPESPDV